VSTISCSDVILVEAPAGSPQGIPIIITFPDGTASESEDFINSVVVDVSLESAYAFGQDLGDDIEICFRPDRNIDIDDQCLGFFDESKSTALGLSRSLSE